MTKLMQWVTITLLYGCFYFTALFSDTFSPFHSKEFRMVIMLSPVILIGLFGVYSVITIAYRVATFNDCTEAAEELREEILEAKKDLTSKGMKFE
ncbi:dolichol-phosphate mannosyltransferase subunit 3-like [Hydractinia symbiolongicarpus]|uniref:dolichol-phosphate mannosyltransferase subunit 3-like n=1 Tax=Hydractinia symbiolongicarpus TaxID=13093 RepID=UPI00254B2773|nr:dolichol-phosphate mannosyltransferase subunit 3-like [Hydractinia symbiolongicarpus]